MNFEKQPQFNPKETDNMQDETLENAEREKLMDDFYKKYFEAQVEGIKRISLNNLKELKEKGINTEQFLDYLCSNYGYLLHGSTNEIQGKELKLQNSKVFATNKSAIAIMRSIYSNVGVNLEYPYFIEKNDKFDLEIHTLIDGKFISVDNGFIYIIDATGFKNDPEGSWQFIKENEGAEFHTIVETEKNDFNYPVKILNDFK
ncbi:MAG: hypothetical protein WCX74_00755 [Candidatus Paceibacterota bacterium]